MAAQLADDFSGAKYLLGGLVQFLHGRLNLSARARRENEPGSTDIIGRSRQRLTKRGRKLAHCSTIGRGTVRRTFPFLTVRQLNLPVPSPAALAATAKASGGRFRR